MNRKVVCYILCFVFALTLALGQEEDPALVFPQVVNGGGFVFELSLTNPSYQADSGTIYFRDTNGTPLKLDIAGEIISELTYSIAANGVFKIESSGFGGLQVGYGFVVSESRKSQITGSITYSLNNKDVSVSSSELSKTHNILVEKDDTTNSGIAIVNLNSFPIAIWGYPGFMLEGKFWQSSGEQIILEPGQHYSKFVDEIFYWPSYATLGKIQFISDHKFALVGLRQKTNGTLAILNGSKLFYSDVIDPDIPVDELLIFPQIVNGAGSQSEIFLNNQSISDEEGSIFFRDSNGNPLFLTIDGEEKASINFSIPGYGVWKFKTNGEGGLQVGYAIVETNSQSPLLTGNLIYNINESEISVLSSQPTYEYHMFVERSISTDCGMALLNLKDAEANIDVFLLDHEGYLISSSVIRLPPNQHSAKFINEIFEGVSSTFAGSFQARSETQFSIVGFRQKQSGALSTLCGSDTTGPIDPAIIDSDGGELLSADERVFLEIPPNALSNEIGIEVFTIPNNSTDILSSTSPIKSWNMEPNGQVFDQPINVTIDYSDFSEIVAENEGLGIIHWSKELGYFENIPVINDPNTKTLKFSLDSFSEIELVRRWTPGGLFHDHPEGWSVFGFKWVTDTIYWYLDETTLNQATSGSFLTRDSIEKALDIWESKTSAFVFEETDDQERANLVFKETGTLDFSEALVSVFGVYAFGGKACFPWNVDLIEFKNELTNSDAVGILVASDSIRESPASNEALYLKVILHEIGHALGIAHPWEWVGAKKVVMDPETFIPVTELHEWDIAALQYLYGGPHPKGEWVKLADFPYNQYASVNDIAIDPNNNSVLYAGTNAGIFKTTDGGLSWEKRSNGLPVNVEISRLEIDWRDISGDAETRTIFAGTGSGLFKSSSSGQSWSRIDSLDDILPVSTYSIFKLILDPLNPDTLYTMPWNSKNLNAAGLARSLNGGDSWEKLIFRFPGCPDDTSLCLHNTYLDLHIHPLNSTTLYASGFAGVQKSTDMGETWTEMSEGMGFAYPTGGHVIGDLALDPNYPSILYAFTPGCSENMWKTLNEAQIWEPLPHNPNRECKWTPECTAILSNSQIFTHPIQSGLIFFVGIGIWVTSDDGQTWKPLNDGLPNPWSYSPMYHIYTDVVFDPQNPSVMYIALYDRSNLRGAGVWKFVPSGD